MKDSKSPLVLALVLLLCAWQAEAAPLTVDLISGATIGGGGGNPNNGGVFQNPPTTNPPPSVGGVTTTLIARSGGNSTPGIVTYNVVDAATGADFNFDVTYEGLLSDSSGTITPGVQGRFSGGHFSVDSPLPGENRNAIDSAASLNLSGGDFEFARLSLGNIVVNSAHTVSTAGFETLYLKLAQDSPDEAGEVRQAGTTTVLGSYSGPFASINSGPVGLTPSTSIDYVPTGDAAAIQGFQVTFDVNDSQVIPEPASLSVWFLGAGLWSFRTRRRS